MSIVESREKAPDLSAAYRVMRTIREFEERLHTEFATGSIPGAIHLYAGQEAVAAGVIAQLRDDDYVTSTHRGHGHAIAKGCDLTAIALEVYCRSGGLCDGKGGSMHIADFNRGMLGANGIAAGGVPIACGAALSAKMRGTAQVSVAFVGDGGANQGSFAESLNLAAVWQLPVVFVVENNGYAQSTGPAFHSRGIDVADRAPGFGIPATVVDGYDFRAVHDAAQEAVDRARRGDGPSLVECKAVRFHGHMEGWDQQGYRAPGEVAELRAEHDCLQILAADAQRSGELDETERAAIDNEVRMSVDEAIRHAAAAPVPAGEDLLAAVYASY